MNDVPIIRIVEKGGELITLDNRRLAGFQAVKIESIPVQRVSLNNPLIFNEFKEKFNPINNGNNIVIIEKSALRTAEELNLRLYGKIK